MGTPSVLPGFTAESALGLTSRSYGYLGAHYSSIPNGGKAMEPEGLANLSTKTNEKPASVPSERGPAMAPLVPQQSDQPLPTVGRGATSMPTLSYVYALGRIEPRFPTLGVEKEFAQATRGGDMTGLTNRQAVHDVLKQQRYLVRQLCWVLTIEGMEN